MAWNVSDPAAIPQEYRQRLSHLALLFHEYQFVEQLLDSPELADIAGELDEMCFTDRVVGFHFTRGTGESINEQGLIVSTGADRRRVFLEQYGHLFTPAQRTAIEQSWSDYFDRNQDRARDGKVWFTLTQEPLADGGADRLLTHYGGESIYMPLTELTDVAEVLRSIGTPMVVECSLDPHELRFLIDRPCGTVWLSSYHCMVNPNANQHDLDVYSTKSIPPSWIRSIKILDRP